MVSDVAEKNKSVGMSIEKDRIISITMRPSAMKIGLFSFLGSSAGAFFFDSAFFFPDFDGLGGGGFSAEIKSAQSNPMAIFMSRNRLSLIFSQSLSSMYLYLL